MEVLLDISINLLALIGLAALALAACHAIVASPYAKPDPMERTAAELASSIAVGDIAPGESVEVPIDVAPNKPRPRKPRKRKPTDGGAN